MPLQRLFDLLDALRSALGCHGFDSQELSDFHGFGRGFGQSDILPSENVVQGFVRDVENLRGLDEEGQEVVLLCPSANQDVTAECAGQLLIRDVNRFLEECHLGGRMPGAAYNEHGEMSTNHWPRPRAAAFCKSCASI